MNKRLIVLILSFATIVAYGYALGGLGSYAAGRPQPVPMIGGLVIGTVCGYFAIKIWKVYLTEIAEEDRRIVEELEKELAESKKKNKK